MSQPQKYEKTTTFANLKNVTQAFPQIDKELNNVATSINEIRDNLRIIQRDDGDVIITKNIEDALMEMAKDGVDTYGASIKATANNAVDTSNNAVVIANNAYNKAESAETTANNAVDTANESAQTVIETVASISQTQREVDAAIANLPSDISGEVSAQTANIPTLIQQAVDAAVVEKSGVTEESITTALGYKPASPASVTAEETARQTADSTLQENITALDNSLKTVAKTGAYSDLTGTPTLATVATSGSYNDLFDKPSIPTVPTNVSAFTNDAGYLTQHQSLAGYATTQQLSGYLPRSGGTMTGVIDFAEGQTLPVDIQQDGQAVVSGEYLHLGRSLISDKSIPSDNKLSLSNILPNDGYVYECLVTVQLTTGASNGSYATSYVSSDVMSTSVMLCRAIARSAYTALCGGTGSIVVGGGRFINLNTTGGGKIDSFNLVGCRRLYKA